MSSQAPKALVEQPKDEPKTDWKFYTKSAFGIEDLWRWSRIGQLLVCITAKKPNIHITTVDECRQFFQVAGFFILYEGSASNDAESPAKAIFYTEDPFGNTDLWRWNRADRLLVCETHRAVIDANDVYDCLQFFWMAGYKTIDKEFSS